MNKLAYIKFSKSQLEKIGYTVVYLSKNIPQLSKTKLLKLLYILDEISIKKSGIPFLNLKYKVWKFGPVSEELFIDLSSEPKLLEDYIEKNNEEGVNFIIPIVDFNDDEFSDNDIELMDFVIEKFGNKSAKELISYTHRTNAPWYNTAKENDVLELLENEVINNTEYLINMEQLIAHDYRKRAIYSDFIESN
ncbi:Panacea domain-containing protein [Flavobacterium dauae]|uniref:Panacea domain-containing protein n=1 Tax=Flavobacterium dauae TaxID=1563479 RepID=UPI00101B3E3A|nr:Panacea domain-containing protein [Flavobacterium dauae]WLD24730.1 Panacea domain-containing protein [Flavobacterium dauae]